MKSENISVTCTMSKRSNIPYPAPPENCLRDWQIQFYNLPAGCRQSGISLFFFPAVGILKIKISSRSSPFRNIIFRVGAPRFRIHMIYFLNNSLYHFSIHQMFYDVYIGVLRAIQNCFVATRRRTMWRVCGRVGVYIRHASIDRREREISVGLYSIHDRPQTQSLTSSDVMSGTDE